MSNGPNSQDDRKDSGGAGFAVSPPAVSLPKGGGAIRGIGEKFAANPVTGTGSMTVPIATSPGRSGFGPHLSISYDSGAGNGPFGFGWNLSLPQITRKTDKGLPRYQDGQGQDPDSDAFILSGAEDLVPVYRQDPEGIWVGSHQGYRSDADGFWVRDQKGHLVIHEDQLDGYRVRRYRPRIEGLFARIERWTNETTGEIHWRSISRDNITTLYGKDNNSRIFDPADSVPAHPTRIFSWQICESYDDKGNAIVYKYAEENSNGIDQSQANERNRIRGANRYLKRIKYGNRISRLRPAEFAADPGWMFEVVFDYDDHDPIAPKPRDNEEKDSAGAFMRPWSYRQDPFSSYRAGFEVRTCRLCQRVLMFHHFPGEEGVDSDCLVRSTDFKYSYEKDSGSAQSPIYSFIISVTQTGYKRSDGGGYLTKSLPPVEFAYSTPIVQETVEEIDSASLENLPVGLDGAVYQWTDLHGEGIPGILTEQAEAWFYKRNLSPIPEKLPDGRERVRAQFAPLETVASKPSLALTGGQAQFMDLAGDGQPDLVVLDGPMPGLYEHDEEEGWQPFRSFTSRLHRDMRDPNLKFVDLDGDGHADALISEDNAFIWHASLAEEGFGPARRVAQALDEEKGPRLVFADGTQSIYLADLSGDGLTDLVRISNGEACYWPNLGYGRFGAKVTMDHAPHFDTPDQFDHKRIRLADIDGSGTTDIIYLHRDGVRLYFNQSGNSWSEPQQLNVFPRVDDLVSIVPNDLFGNGTACLVWSSPLPGDARRPMRYVNLMGGQKPHLLVKTINNLGAETVVQYAPSTKFYLQDKRDGKPWITRLPFPVHVVERVETYDHISRNRFATRYAYHHGYFDGDERELRGFGKVEQWDTEELAALSNSDTFPVGDNVTAESHVPPVYTKTWFHTGLYLGRDHVSDFFAGLLNATDQGEYFREPGLTVPEAEALLLPDTVLPPGLTLAEEREACRSLKGAMLRQEVYALDGSDKEPHPYTVTEQSFTIRPLQPRASNRHAVFFTHPREAISYHYERNPADPRVQHALTLEVDAYGNVLKEAAIGYGRRKTIRVVDEKGKVQQVPNPGLNALAAADQGKQTDLLATYTENRVTNTVETAESHRNPLPCEARTFQLTGYAPTGPDGRFQPTDLVEPDPDAAGRLRHIFLGEPAYEDTATGNKQRRPIEWVRTLYRKDDLSGLLPLRQLASLGLAGESYKLAFTPGLLDQVFQRPHAGQPPEALLPNPAAVLGGQAADRGGYVQSQVLKADGRFPNSDADDHWWIPSGRSFFSTNSADPAATELAQARKHFFLPRRYRDPFGQDAFVDFDADDLLMVKTRDALGNRVTVDANDYRVLQPRLVSDPNRNQTEVAFDTLGMVVGTAVMGKPLPAPAEGDTLSGFVTDLTQAQLDAFFGAADPHANAPALLRDATTRIVYDLDRFRRTQQANLNDPTKWQPACAATLARETHTRTPLPPQGLKIQLSFGYSDGFGREIQKKIQAEPEKVAGVAGPPRWVGSGWTIFNNKGKPVRQYEPFFTSTHGFEFDVRVGVSPVLFYDPIERVVATLHPNHTYEKVVFDPWRQTTWDVNDTVLSDPRTDADIKGYTKDYFASLPASTPALPWQTWHAQRQGGALGVQEQAAADKAAAHANTPATAHFDSLGRPFLTLAHNGLEADGAPIQYPTRVELDIEGNQRAVRDAIIQNGDALGRIVMRYDYDMLSNRIHQASMEAGARWMLNDVSGKPIRAWDSRGHTFCTEYDPLRRPVRISVTGADPANPTRKLLTERLVYGEQHPEDYLRNLRGKLYLHLDQAGAVANEAHDFKGNPLQASRRLAMHPKQVQDWQSVDSDHVALPTDATDKLDLARLEAALVPWLEDETFTSTTTYDALNRPVTLTTPHTPTMKPNVIQHRYNDANLLERVDVNLRGATSGGQAVWTAFVENIDYDAKGQRVRIDYGNGVRTTYEYDPLTFRLVHLLTRRDAIVFPDDCPQPPPDDWPGCQVQNLCYTYDPAGNITHIRDDAQQTIFFRNTRVEPSAEYTYDAIYRLIEATGREHLGQAGGVPIPHSHNDAPRVAIWNQGPDNKFHPGDGNAMGSYCETYVYDAVGNIMEMKHRPSCPEVPTWTRTYAYNEPSLIEPAKQSNRLSRTKAGNGPSEKYIHDAHGNMIRMPHLGGGADPAPNMHWDYRDQLSQVDSGGGGTAYYVYDASGQRVRKVWEKSPGLTEERIYLGSFEIFLRRNGAGVVTLERETLHMMDDKQRIAMVEKRTLDTAGDDKSPEQLTRYQFGNHLGSASLELDEDAQIISYEEYTPYGSTAYQAVRSKTETPKRCRYTGKERDEETGVYYHGARYYAPCLGRWASIDPVVLMEPYQYSRCNPVRFVDPGGKQPVIALRTNALLSPSVFSQQFLQNFYFQSMLQAISGVKPPLTFLGTLADAFRPKPGPSGKGEDELGVQEATRRHESFGSIAHSLSTGGSPPHAEDRDYSKLIGKPMSDAIGAGLDASPKLKSQLEEQGKDFIKQHWPITIPYGGSILGAGSALASEGRWGLLSFLSERIPGIWEKAIEKGLELPARSDIPIFSQWPSPRTGLGTTVDYLTKGLKLTVEGSTPFQGEKGDVVSLKMGLRRPFLVPGGTIGPSIDMRWEPGATRDSFRWRMQLLEVKLPW